MKKLLFLVFIIFSKPGSGASISNFTLSSDIKPPKFIVFGNKSRDCSRSGICHLGNILDRIDGTSAIAVLSYDAFNPRYLTISINKKTGILNQAIVAFFGSGFFEMEADFDIPDEIILQENLSLYKTISEGRYLVKDDGMTISFSVLLK